MYLTAVRIVEFSITTPSMGMHNDQSEKTILLTYSCNLGCGMYFFKYIHVVSPNLARTASSFSSTKTLGTSNPIHINRIRAAEILARLFVHHVAAFRGKQTAINLSKVMKRTTQFEMPMKFEERNQYGGHKYFPIEMKISGCHIRTVL
jgi:hypothetical protein